MIPVDVRRNLNRFNIRVDGFHSIILLFDVVDVIFAMIKYFFLNQLVMVFIHGGGFGSGDGTPGNLGAERFLDYEIVIFLKSN